MHDEDRRQRGAEKHQAGGELQLQEVAEGPGHHLQDDPAAGVLRHAGGRRHRARLGRQQSRRGGGRPQRPARSDQLPEADQQGGRRLRRQEAALPRPGAVGGGCGAQGAALDRQDPEEMPRDRDEGCQRGRRARRGAPARCGGHAPQAGRHDRAPRRPRHPARDLGGPRGAERGAAAAEHRPHSHRRPALRHHRHHPLGRRRHAGDADRDERDRRQGRELPEQLRHHRPVRAEPLEPAGRQVLPHDGRAHERRRRRRLRGVRRQLHRRRLAAQRGLPHGHLRQVPERLRAGRALSGAGLGRVARLQERGVLQLHPGGERYRGGLRQRRHRLLHRRAA